MAVEVVAGTEFSVNELTASTQQSWDWPEAFAAAAEDAVAVVAFALRTSGSGSYPTATISLGDAPAIVYHYEQLPVGAGTGRSNVILALIPLAGAIDGLLYVEWQAVGMEVLTVVQGIVFTGVDVEALASAIAVTSANAATLGPQAMTNGGALVVGGGFYDSSPSFQGADATAYEMLSGLSGFDPVYYTGHEIGFGYRIASAEIDETVASGSDFLPGIAYFLPALAGDAFNCSCEDTTNHRTLAQLRAEIITRLGFVTQQAQVAGSTLEQLRTRIIDRLGFVTAKAAVTGKTLAAFKDYLMARLGFSAQIGSPPPGMAALLTELVNEAQDTLYRQYGYDTLGVAAPTRMTADNNTCSLDAMAIQLLALANAKSHYGQDAKPFYEQYEAYLEDQLRRTPLNLNAQVRCFINDAQQELYRRYGYGTYSPTAPALLAADSDAVTLDSHAVYLLALAQAKSHYEQKDAKVFYDQFETYIKELLQRSPINLSNIITSFLQDAQRQLYRSHATLRTERFYRWTMTAGERYYDLPDNEDDCGKKLDAYKITWVGVEDLNGTWMPLFEGVDPTLYTGVSQRGLPARYEVRQCIEVFPAPDQAYTLRVKGHFGIEAFSADDDKTTIDDQAVFLLALAQAKSHYEQPDAKNYFSQASNYIGSLVAGAHHTARYVPRAAVSPSVPQPRMVQFDE